MAHAAVTCLRNLIHDLLNSSHITISLASPMHTILESAYEELGSLQELLETSGEFEALDMQIIGAVREIEDSLEIHELNHFLPQSDETLVRVEKLRNIREEYCTKSLDQPPLIDQGGGRAGSSSNMVGLSEQLSLITRYLLQSNSPYVFWIIGMAGIGKTAMAERIYDDPSILEAFDCRAFVRVGKDYQMEEMERAVMDQVNPNKEEDYNILDDKRYLIVLDDVWSLDFWDDFFSQRQGDKGNGSCIVVTSRIEYLAMYIEDQAYFYMPFLNNNDSWDLLCHKLFSEKPCPRDLETAGRKIAKKCDGLPLTIITIADILSRTTMTEDHWNEVAQQKQNPVFEDAYEQMLEILYPSYYHLPPQAKTCFLYMGAFPPKHHVRRSNLVYHWCAEGFLEPNDSDHASKCFDDITFHHVVVPAPELSSDGQTYKACTLHSVFRHLCRKEVRKNEFLHIIDGLGGEEDGLIDGKRRLAVYNNVLLGIGAVYTSTDKPSPSSVRSLLCTGPYHPYQVPIDFDLRLLRVCDALTIRFYEFPTMLLELLQLRYLAITSSKSIPPSISKLWKLEYLVVEQHLRSIKSTAAETYLPVEIWDLQELLHLQIPGRNLPNPPCGGGLPKLVTLLDVGIYTCTQGVLTSTPSLHKLRVQIEIPPNSGHVHEPLRFLDHISHLNPGIISLQCKVVNPIVLKPGLIVAAPPSLSLSSSSIKKLTLSGLGYPWEYLNVFAKLPHLKVLKLQHFAFHGEMWEVGEEGFLNLESLFIEDNHLERWKAGDGTFPCLNYLTLRSCYTLQHLPSISSLLEIELVDCHSAAVTWANETGSHVLHSWDAPVDSENYIHSENYISSIYSTHTS